MKPLVPILGAAWILTLGASYLIGKKSTASEPLRESPASAAAPGPSSKSARSGGRPSRDPGGPTRRSLRGETGRIVSELSPRDAVVELAQLNDPIERAKGFLALIDRLGAAEFRDVVADFRALGMTEQRMSEYGMLLHAWGKADPVEALAYAFENTGTPFARQTVLASWASDDPDAAIAFARENHQGESANPLLVGVIKGLVANDLPRATELLEGLPYSRERGEALQSMLPVVMEEGLDTAMSWSRKITDSQLRTGALTFILSDVSQSAPETAARIVSTLDDEAAIRVADQVAGALARVDLREAITWSEALADDVRSEAVEGIVGQYASQDPQAAAQWLNSLAGTTNLDPAIRSFVWTAQRREPELAAEWIGQIQDEGRRNEMYRGVLSRWWGTDAAAAQQWIQSNPDLPEALRNLPSQLQEGQERRNLRSR